MTSFPAVHPRPPNDLRRKDNVRQRKSDSRTILTRMRLTQVGPQCSPFNYGIARIDETVNNIAHLSDVANITCSVEAATCARTSHIGDSSIFFCNFVCCVFLFTASVL